ncbi:MAG TPA: bifunctional YncE family protein/alkaline phosphatase family protein [Pyrinomonadaceae bacterium]|nr:bifunctional YncE family protein/alkaline phosphatase family protein [Pyrinomonadaceae bacterium]
MAKKRFAVTLLSLLLISFILISTFPAFSSSASRNVADEPASQGQPITPAGSLVQDLSTRQAAVGALPVNFVRTPDKLGPDGLGRYLISVNSGYGIQFNAAANLGQQSLSIIDLTVKPTPAVIQNVFFPSPQSANVGVVFASQPDDDGSYAMYVSGGFENKVWIFQFTVDGRPPVTPASAGPNTTVEAPFIDVSPFATVANSSRYNSDRVPVYPTGITLSPDNNTLYVANNLADSLGIVADVRAERRLSRVDLRPPTNLDHATYPYQVVTIGGKIFVSCWNDSSVAVVQANDLNKPVTFVKVGAHPTAMLLNPQGSRLYVANSDDDSVSVIDTQKENELERISVRISEQVPAGNSPEGLALKDSFLYVANSHSNSVVVVKLSSRALGGTATTNWDDDERSSVKGFIPTGQYPSAVAMAGNRLFVGNGKGTGLENSSVVVNDSGRVPNVPNDRYPAGTGRGSGQGGQYGTALVIGNISQIIVPDEPGLVRYSQQVMRNNGLLGRTRVKLFPNQSPIKHVIYVIKENRTYDQVFGDVEKSGDGRVADGDRALAIFGSTEAASRPNGTSQDVSPNHRALALRFGLFDRFFVNSEASPDGHNWSTAAFSTDYVDKSFRWAYSKRGRTYDFEGFNRLPNYEPLRGQPSMFGPSVTTEAIADFMRKFIPYLHNSRDIAEPQTLYLWDSAARAGLSYRNYGEFIPTLSEADVKAVKENRSKAYPDISPTVSAFATKKSLEGHFNEHYRNFDLDTPDAMTADSYKAAKESANSISPLISADHLDTRFRGNSRIDVWLKEFRGFVSERSSNGRDRFPNLSIVRLPNDHTDGIKAQKPTPQFFVADNDYALGLMVEAVSNSIYWKDTAIVVVEDDAQDGPDHVDAHRSVGLIISAYNRPGLLVHEFHSTVSFIRTIEVLLGMAPMNQLDATAVPADIFRPEPDLRPFKAMLPNITLDNLFSLQTRDFATLYWMKRTEEQDLAHADMADPGVLNRIIWFSVKGNVPMPEVGRLPAFDAMRLGLLEEREEIAERAEKSKRKSEEPD